MALDIIFFSKKNLYYLILRFFSFLSMCYLFSLMREQIFLSVLNEGSIEPNNGLPLWNRFPASFIFIEFLFDAYLFFFL